VRSALAAIACLLLFAPAAHAARGMEIGVQDDGQFLHHDAAVRQAALAHARALGAAVLRANVPWADVVSEPTARTAPAAPVYDFARYDRLIDEAAAYGIRVQLTLTGPAPAWATANRKVSVTGPDPARFGAFAGAAATHFRGRVRALSIWNEPNWHGLLAPERICRRGSCVKTSARRYRALYQSAYAAIKRADPKLPVWIGETNPYVNRRKQSTAPLAWLRQLTCTDKAVTGCRGTLRADGYAHHPYAPDRAPAKPFSGRDNVTLSSLARLRTQLKALRKRIRIGRGTPIYLTEFAYFSSGPNAHSKRKRATYTRAAFELALKSPQVRQLVYYQLVDPSASMTWRSGLITTAGAAHPAYRALVGFAAARRSRLTVPRGPLALPPAPAVGAPLPPLPPPAELPAVGVPLL
jgi:hypothetical protein